jgi:hypothetical protein
MAGISLDDAIRIAADGDAILFVGAGVGFLVDCPTGKIPDGTTLSNRILNRNDSSTPATPLDKAAGYAIRNLGGVEYLYDILKQNLTVNSVDKRLKELYCLPWRRIYTTNYDDAIEASRKGVTATNSCTLEDPVSKARSGSVIHLNGALSRVSPASIEKESRLSP